MHPQDVEEFRDNVAMRVAPTMITALGAKPEYHGATYSHLFKHAAEASYTFADAMLEARKPKQQKEPTS